MGLPRGLPSEDPPTTQSVDLVFLSRSLTRHVVGDPGPSYLHPEDVVEQESPGVVGLGPIFSESSSPQGRRT